MPQGIDHSRGGFANWASRLALARVESYDFQIDQETNEQLTDTLGNPIPTGLLNILLVEANAPRKKVPYVMPASGNSMYLGGMPELGTMCVVGWRQQNQPIIVGFVPYGVDQMVRNRQTIPNLVEGELLLQASERSIDSDAEQNFFRGARVWLDRYGRCIIDVQDYKLTIGYLLSDEFTPNVQFKKDPVTGENVFLSEKIVGGFERRVDDKGNEVRDYGGTSYVKTGGSFDLNVEGQNIQQAAQGTSVGDRSGNKLEITDEGKVRLASPSGSLEFETAGSQFVKVSGNVQRSVVGSVFETIGDRYDVTFGGDYVSEMAGTMTETTTGGDWVEMVTDGLKQIFTSEGIDLDTEGLKPVNIGGVNASEPVPLGNVLVNALNDLQQILQTPPGIGFGNLGGPVPLNPAIITALQAWVAQYLTTVQTNILSRKVFSERGQEA